MRDRTLRNLVGTPEHSEVAYDSLMPRRVSNLLLVSSPYDCYTFIEDGRLTEMVYSEFIDLDLRGTPSIERASTAEEALERLQGERFDLIISMARVGDMDVREFGRAVESLAPEVPVVLLACNPRELSLLPPLPSLPGIDSTFVWLGDVRLFLAIIKHVEDHDNAAHAGSVAGGRSIVLIEDSVQFYSAYLPMLYTEILRRTRELATESLNRAQKVMRMRARPKVLLARNAEEGMHLCRQYEGNLLGVILDVAFPRQGRLDPMAGFDFAQELKRRVPDLPVLIQSDSPNAARADELGLPFIDKGSPTLLADLRGFLKTHLGFGDLDFVDTDGSVVSRASDLRTLEWALQAVPDELLLGNVSRNAFYAWLMARTEFALADQVRRIVEAAGQDRRVLRTRLLEALSKHRARAMAGVVADFSSGTFDGKAGFVRIGQGSLGGKGRGLAFIDSLLTTYRLEHRFAGVRIFVPPTAVLATGVFDEFMESSGLLPYALQETDDRKITAAFLEATLPRTVVDCLWTYIHWVRYPLAVRSSSLLEDASYQPFAGIYQTYMVPNSHDDPEVRLQELCVAIKRVYASTFHTDAKAYMESLPNRLEEEKMAVVIQQVVGRRHGVHVYPDIAGVGRSVSYYPLPGMRPEDGVVSVALGLGKTVVDGGRCVRFCPAYPRRPAHTLTPREQLENSQQSFFALDVSRSPFGEGTGEGREDGLTSLGLEVAEVDGTLGAVGSVYSADDDAVHDGTSRRGARLVSMAGVLKGSRFPLAEVTAFLMKVGAAAASCPVEIEFAVTFAEGAEPRDELAFLQLRPLVLGGELQDVAVERIDRRDALCISHRALGNGSMRDICDVVYVRRDGFDRMRSGALAEEIGRLNARLKAEQRRYLLMGPGRWGSTDPWLGIPVRWAQISQVACIVEMGFEDAPVEPSQGSHFFQNLMAFGIGYLTVDLGRDEDFLDQAWLEALPATAERGPLRHVQLPAPLVVTINGRRSIGVVAKPIEGGAPRACVVEASCRACSGAR